jgi:hypothetical protein
MDATNLLKKRITNLSDKEIKELDKETPKNVIRIMSHYSGMFSDSKMV